MNNLGSQPVLRPTGFNLVSKMATKILFLVSLIEQTNRCFSKVGPNKGEVLKSYVQDWLQQKGNRCSNSLSSARLPDLCLNTYQEKSARLVGLLRTTLKRPDGKVDGVPVQVAREDIIPGVVICVLIFRIKCCELHGLIVCHTETDCEDLVQPRTPPFHLAFTQGKNYRRKPLLPSSKSKEDQIRPSELAHE